MTAYKTYAATLNPTHTSLNISDFGSHGDDGGNGKAAGRGGSHGRGGDKPYAKKRSHPDEQKRTGGKVEFRYYDYREYAALSADQKQELKRLRAEASDLNSAKISSMETEIADLHRPIGRVRVGSSPR